MAPFRASGSAGPRPGNVSARDHAMAPDSNTPKGTPSSSSAMSTARPLGVWAARTSITTAPSDAVLQAPGPQSRQRSTGTGPMRSAR